MIDKKRNEYMKEYMRKRRLEHPELREKDKLRSHKKKVK